MKKTSGIQPIIFYDNLLEKTLLAESFSLSLAIKSKPCMLRSFTRVRFALDVGFMFLFSEGPTWDQHFIKSIWNWFWNRQNNYGTSHGLFHISLYWFQKQKNNYTKHRKTCNILSFESVIHLFFFDICKILNQKIWQDIWCVVSFFIDLCLMYVDLMFCWVMLICISYLKLCYYSYVIWHFWIS